LRGVNERGVAVGFYTNNQGSNRGYEYHIRTRTFSRVLVPGAPRMGKGPSLTAAAINNHGDVAGFYTAADGATVGFVKMAGGRFITLAYPGASMTQALARAGSGEVGRPAGAAGGPRGSPRALPGRAGPVPPAVDAPPGVTPPSTTGGTAPGALVGFYPDAGGNPQGMLAHPRR